MNNPSRWGRSPGIDESFAQAFELAPDLIHLNNGSFGAVPRRVREEQDRIRAHMERDPTTFFADELPPALRAMAGNVAARFGGAGDDWVFLENATQAVNGVLSSLPLKPGDEIATTSHAYGAVMKAMREWARRRDLTLVVAALHPIAESDDAIVEAIASVLSERCKLLVIDHITSATATVFPVKRIVAQAHRLGVPVLIDGAHAPGQVELDVPDIGADWYTGNAHKWLFAPRGCGILWTAPKWQSVTLPPILSHGTDGGYHAAFDWIGTRDVSPWLCFEIAAKCHDEFGGPALTARNRRLAQEGAVVLCDGLEACCAAPHGMRAAMATILLKDSVPDPAFPAIFRRALMERGVVAPVSGFAGRLWFRISAQAYNRIDDYRRCLAAVLELRDGPFREHFA